MGKERQLHSLFAAHRMLDHIRADGAGEHTSHRTQSTSAGSVAQVGTGSAAKKRGAKAAIILSRLSGSAMWGTASARVARAVLRRSVPALLMLLLLVVLLLTLMLLMVVLLLLRRIW